MYFQHSFGALRLLFPFWREQIFREKESGTPDWKKVLQTNFPIMSKSITYFKLANHTITRRNQIGELNFG